MLLRSALTHQAATKRIREIFADQITASIARVMDDPDEAATRAGLMTSQVLGAALCHFVPRFPPMVDIPRDELI